MSEQSLGCPRDPKAIPTTWNGIKYRSRLEARWAVFFDEMKIEVQYEPDAFRLPRANYLPDFYLEQFRFFGEVKPIELDARESQLIRELSAMTRCPVLQLIGVPNFRIYDAVQPVFLEDGQDIEIVDYVLDVKAYPKLTKEGRLFGSTGHERGTLPSMMFSREYRDAVMTAKGKRFDPGGRY